MERIATALEAIAAALTKEPAKVPASETKPAVRQRWTIEETKRFIKLCAGGSSLNELQEAFPTRTAKSIINKKIDIFGTSKRVEV